MALLLTGFGLVSGPAAYARGAPDSLADLAEKLLPAVVNITTTTKITDANRGDPNLEELFRQFFDRQKRGQGGQGQGDQGQGDPGQGGGSDQGDGSGGPPQVVTSLGSGF